MKKIEDINNLIEEPKYDWRGEVVPASVHERLKLEIVSDYERGHYGNRYSVLFQDGQIGENILELTKWAIKVIRDNPHLSFYETEFILKKVKTINYTLYKKDYKGKSFEKEIEVVEEYRNGENYILGKFVFDYVKENKGD